MADNTIFFNDDPRLDSYNYIFVFTKRGGGIHANFLSGISICLYIHYTKGMRCIKHHTLLVPNFVLFSLRLSVSEIWRFKIPQCIVNGKHLTFDPCVLARYWLDHL